ncbi:hypothetical protein G6F63_015755 [Rhizopus arrhizus]|uniref:Uncharacterized protein n=1 Tax=Rhizopus delemar TaxID=936053 RepID=A0A9P6Y5U7_9FUNG|nr:hypothetical protein G6F63_015755 [Rhizopus arrhizus]KAG1539783.1 hypothetical protein G6F50_014451 [Rhizopus delemar]
MRCALACRSHPSVESARGSARARQRAPDRLRLPRCDRQDRSRWPSAGPPPGLRPPAPVRAAATGAGGQRHEMQPHSPAAGLCAAARRAGPHPAAGRAPDDAGAAARARY